MASSGHAAPQLVAAQDGARTEPADEAAIDGAVVYLKAAPPAPGMALPGTEQRMRALEEQAIDVANTVAATRAILALVERRLDELSDVQAGVEALRAELDARPRPAGRRSRAKHPCPLSARELELLAALADGKVYKQIAHELSLSVSTVRSHLHHVYAKLDVQDRAQAVLLATKRGWI